MQVIYILIQILILTTIILVMIKNNHISTKRYDAMKKLIYRFPLLDKVYLSNGKGEEITLAKYNKKNNKIYFEYEK